MPIADSSAPMALLDWPTAYVDRGWGPHHQYLHVHADGRSQYAGTVQRVRCRLIAGKVYGDVRVVSTVPDLVGRRWMWVIRLERVT